MLYAHGTADLFTMLYAHGTADMHVVMNPAVTNSAWFVCHNKPLNQQCIVRSGSPHDDAWIILLVTRWHEAYTLNPIKPTWQAIATDVTWNDSDWLLDV